MCATPTWGRGGGQEGPKTPPPSLLLPLPVSLLYTHSLRDSVGGADRPHGGR
jgi:hypothetical protein